MTAIAEPNRVKKGGLADLRSGRRDMLMLDPRIIAIEPGHNPRNFDLPDQRAALDELKANIRDNGTLFPVAVRYDVGTNRAILVDGERRLRANLELIAEGVEIEAIPAIGVKGDEAERLVLAITANTGKPLGDVELGGAFRRFAAFGWDTDKIVKRTGYPAWRVTRAIELAEAPMGVQRAVASGEATPALAVKVTREHGDAAPAVLKKRVAEAKAAGKPTATRTKTIALPKPSKTDAVGEAAQSLFEIAIAAMDESDDVRLPRSTFYDLGKALFGERDARVRALAPQ